MAKWEARRAEVQRMVDAEMTDEAIGCVFGVTKSTIYQARLRLGIKRPAKPKSWYLLQAPAAPEALVGETYVDANGQTVTRYPARYSVATTITSAPARPRR